MLIGFFEKSYSLIKAQSEELDLKKVIYFIGFDEGKREILYFTPLR